MAVKVELDKAAVRRVRALSEVCLRDLAPVLEAHAKAVLAESLTLVPGAFNVTRPGELHLKDTDFISGPVTNREAESVVLTAGYMHPQAGPIHEGFHWGEQTREPPHFLKNPAKKGRAKLRRAISAQLLATVKQKLTQ